MIINDAGRKIIMEFESFQSDAYLCPAGIWTIGYGHTGDVKAGDRVTRHQAEAILEYDLQRFEHAIEKLVPKANGNQFSALVSLAFNIGSSALANSRLIKLFKEGGPLAAAPQFDRWVHAGKNSYGAPRVLPGLVRRRHAEKALFLMVPS
jgi:lysozyme